MYVYLDKAVVEEEADEPGADDAVGVHRLPHEPCSSAPPNLILNEYFCPREFVFFPGPPQPRSKPCLALYNPDRIRTVPWSEKKHHTTPRPRKTCRIQSFTRAAPSISRALTQLHKSRSRSPPAAISSPAISSDSGRDNVVNLQRSRTGTASRVPPLVSLAATSNELPPPVVVVNLAGRVT